MRRMGVGLVLGFALGMSGCGGNSVKDGAAKPGTLGGSSATDSGGTGASAGGGSGSSGGHSGGADTGGSSSGGADTGGAGAGGASSGGSDTGGSSTGGAETGEAGAGGSDTGGAGPTCGYLDLECCPDDECLGNRTACDANNRCVPCGDTGEACCKRLDIRSISAGEQNGMCVSHHEVCGGDGLCVACGAEGEACCPNSKCDGAGCCVGGLCVTNETSCGDGLGMCTDGVCANCGAEEGQPCCDGSCGPYLACNASGVCGCGGEGEPCCRIESTCDVGLGCFGYECQSGGTTECPVTAPNQGDECNYLGSEVCKYPGSDPFVWDCLCRPSGWSCVA